MKLGDILTLSHLCCTCKYNAGERHELWSKLGEAQGSPTSPYSSLPTAPKLSPLPRCLAAEKNPSLDWLLPCTELPSLGIIFKICRRLLEDCHTLLTVRPEDRRELTLKGFEPRARHLPHWLIPTLISKSRFSHLTDDESRVQSG